MKRTILKYLKCPYNDQELELIEINSDQNKDSVNMGLLISRSKHTYCFPILDGIPRIYLSAIRDYRKIIIEEINRHAPDKLEMIENILSETNHSNYPKNILSIKDSFSSEWNAVKDVDYAWGRTLQERRELFEKNLEVSTSDLSNLMILDCGCGHGEVEFAIADSGAEIFAVDFSTTVDAINRRLQEKGISNVHLVQASITELPFKDNIFDIVHSDGVLHHNPDTEEAFNKIITKLKKRSGKAYVMVYSNDYANFFERLITFYLVRFLKVFTTRMSFSTLHRFCKLSAPFVKLYYTTANRLLGKKYYRDRTLSEIHLSLFDGFSPKYANHHSYLEVKNWFQENKFNIIKKTFYNRNGIGVLGIK